jgi:DNA recombination protein RmuC
MDTAGLLLFLLGLALGAGGTWLLLRVRISDAERRGRAAADAQRAELAGQIAIKDQQITDLKESLRQAQQQVDRLGLESTDLQTRLAESQTRLTEERKAAEEKLALLNQAQLKLSEAFRALSADALKSNNQAFLDLARATLETFHKQASGDLEKRQQAIDELVRPLKESLAKVEQNVQELERKRAEAYGGLSEHLRSMSSTQAALQKETANLVRALRAPSVRGRWGELQLQRVVELAGMVEYCDFITQESVATEGGALRPDLVVRLPGGRQVVVDAKTPLAAVLEAIEAPDDEARSAALAEHARQVRIHLEQLGRKAYWDQFSPAPEFVVMFLPGETFFHLALQQDPELIETGANRRVLPASPVTLIALLRAVAYGWRQEQMAKNAEEISRLGRDLYERIGKLGEHFERHGRSLKNSVDAYNDMLGTLETRVLPAARRFRELGAAGGDELPSPAPLDVAVREPRAPEIAP